MKIEFEHLLRFDSRRSGISIPTTLRNGEQVIDLLASVDTGATYCLFERRHGEMLGLDVESGEPKKFSTATGSVNAFGHPVILETSDLRFNSMVYFFEDPLITKNLLGRVGWLDRIRFGLIEQDQTVYLADYDFESDSPVQ